ncbi:glucokinase (plasmid) [Leisingera aquaemixtae]|uniref:Glucokinase n=1 Tax=Leisingera aquaemixtae TaxID=1396826 RepID=A0ABY5WQQ0_9RHOB|nr:glucokinase [Leisingera aquaemixtae]UWQ43830.1 glucokinase [Leisingera aquaemixtae]
MTRLRLAADVGGTNTRLGLARDGVLLADTVQSFRNEAFSGFTAVLDQYLQKAASGGVAEVAIAIAGPVTGATARLTNRDWHFDAAALSRHLDGAPVHLLNDLAALGQACPHLGAECLDTVIAPADDAGGDGQRLVAGIGTGFNLSPVLHAGGRVQCLNVEYGHVSLPLDVAEHLRSRIGDAAAEFRTVEHLFSGRGYAAVRAQFADDDAGTQAFQGFYAELLSLLARNLVLAFLPAQGIYFAGAVARSLLASPARQVFAEAFRQPFALDTGIEAPVYVILDDAAALKGCAAVTVNR